MGWKYKTSRFHFSFQQVRTLWVVRTRRPNHPLDFRVRKQIKFPIPCLLTCLMGMWLIRTQQRMEIISILGRPTGNMHKRSRTILCNLPIDFHKILCYNLVTRWGKEAREDPKAQVAAVRLPRQRPTAASRSPTLRDINVEATYGETLEPLGW